MREGRSFHYLLMQNGLQMSACDARSPQPRRTRSRRRLEEGAAERSGRAKRQQTEQIVYVRAEDKCYT